MIFYCIVRPDANKHNDVSEPFSFLSTYISEFIVIYMQSKFTFNCDKVATHFHIDTMKMY